jgi:ribosome maturation factor RimP
MSSRTPTADQARITALLQPVVAAAGFDLEDVRITSAGRRSKLLVVVDADGGISLDDVAEVGRIVSGALDEADAADAAEAEAPGGLLGANAYTLEVSSPGVDRPLTEPRQRRRAAGRLVRTRIGDTAVEARVVTADEAVVVLDVAGDHRSVPYRDLGKGAVQLEFARGREDTG